MRGISLRGTTARTAMAWERRRRGPSGGYYYQSVRTPKGVRKVYYGRGAKGALIAAAVEARKAAVEAARKEVAAEQDTFAEAERLMEALATWAEFLVSAWHVTNNHYYHRGEWRRSKCPSRSH
jgi:hypothetical protein